MVTMIDLAPTGVDRQVSMIFGYDNGAQAYLNTTSGAKTPTTATISGTKARIEIDGDFYAPSAFSLITRAGEARRFEFETQGRGLHFEAAEVARLSGTGDCPREPADAASARNRIDHARQWRQCWPRRSAFAPCARVAHGLNVGTNLDMSSYQCAVAGHERYCRRTRQYR